jgi:uncharacterized protein
MRKFAHNIKMFNRAAVQTVRTRISEPVRNIQIVSGPRRVGKTVAVQTALNNRIVESADAPRLSTGALDDRASTAALRPGQVADLDWLAHLWNDARTNPRFQIDGRQVLAIDEIQKIHGWAGTVKGLWDHDRAAGIDMHVILLGSSAALMRQGMNESLAGRFESIGMTHWSFSEMREAFDFSFDEYCYFGGYPGLANLISDPPRWRNAVNDQIIVPTIEQDIRDLIRIDKPALFNRLFQVASRMSSQVVAYSEILAGLHQDSGEVGNTATLARYTEVMFQAGMVTALQKYAPNVVKQRASKPKFQVLNTALMSASHHLSFAQARAGEHWGRVVESAIGAHLLNAKQPGDEVHYWIPKRGIGEVDFVVRCGAQLYAIEVKAGAGGSTRWLKEFAATHNRAKCLMVTSAPQRSVDQDGIVHIPLLEAITSSIEEWA